MSNKYHRWIYDDNIMDQFWELGFEDISYSNDLCDSVGYDFDNDRDNAKWENYCQIFLANSKVNNAEQEQFTTSILNFYENGDYVEMIFETDDITELLSMFKSYLESK
jgi:hypothetical protein